MAGMRVVIDVGDAAAGCCGGGFDGRSEAVGVVGEVELEGGGASEDDLATMMASMSAREAEDPERVVVEETSERVR